MKKKSYILIWKPFKETAFISWVSQQFDSKPALETGKKKILVRFPNAVFTENLVEATPIQKVI